MAALPSRLSALCVGLLLALLLAEGLVRALYLERRWLPDLVTFQEHDADLPIHRVSADPALGYELVPGSELSTGRVRWFGDAPRELRVNSLGFRDVERRVLKEPGVLRILALGGSNTYGASVTQGNTWPAQLEQVLRERGQAAEVWNLGVDGYVPGQKHLLFDRALEEFAPDLVLMQVFNRGPRHFLPMRRSELVQSFRRDPGHYVENLRAVPEPGSFAFGLFRASALVRAGVLLHNRMERRDKPGVVPEGLWDELNRRDDAALRARLAGDIPVWIVIPPVDLPDGVFPTPPGRTVDLRALAPPSRPDVRDIHPGAAVYRWYAESIADALQAAGD